MEYWIPDIKYRKYQLAVIKRVLEAFFEQDYENVIIEAPTGFGKSVVNYIIARNFQSAWYTTPQVVLLEQLRNDTLIEKLGGIAVLKGKDKYTCPHTGEPVEVAPCQRFRQLKCKTICQWRLDRYRVTHSPISAISFSMMMKTYRLRDFGRRSLLIVDEADNIEDWGADFGTLRFRLGFKPETISEVISWARNKLQHVESRIKELKAKQMLTPKELAILKTLTEQKEKLELFLDDAQKRPNNWTMKKHGFLVELKILNVGTVLKDRLWWRGNKRLITSAVILDADLFMKYTGLEGKTLFLRVPNIFPVENRKVVFMPVTKLRKDMRTPENFWKMVSAIEKIAEEHKKENGIIHCHSYEIAEELSKRLRLKGFKVITHGRKDRDEKFKEFIESRENPKVFISVGFERGIDLKYDLARWQVITKCFTEDVEVLTPSGLKPIKSLKVGDKVISYNIETGELEVDEVVRMYAEHYKGKVIRFTGETYDVRVTPDHLMVGAKRTKDINGKMMFGKYKKYKACELVRSYTKVPIAGEYKTDKSSVCLWDFLEDDEIIRASADKSMPHKLKKYLEQGLINYYPKYEPNNRCYEFKKDITRSYELAKKVFGKLYYKGKYKQSKPHPIEFDAGDFLELCGWYISEGYAYKYSGKDYGTAKAGETYRIIIYQKKYKDRIIDLLTRMNIPFKVYGDRIFIHSYLLYKVFTRWFGKGARDKHISHEVLFGFSSEHLRRMFWAMVLGDGSITKSGSIVYYTASKRLVDDVCILARLIGMAVSKVTEEKEHKGNYAIYFVQRSHSYITKDTVKIEDYDGMVYCPTVKKNGTVVAGINRKLIIAGNCPFPDQQDPRVYELWVKRGAWNWARYQTIKRLVQACGRIVRAEDDYGVTYILDAGFEHLFRYKKMFPAWFVDAVEQREPITSR